jgi:hypothetical protein
VGTAVAWGKDKKLVQVKVEVVSAEGIAESSQAGGIAGSIAGRKISTDAWTARVIINGEHAGITCYENHNPCHFLGAGTYDGELKTHPNRSDYAGYSSDPDLWIHYIRPLDHRDIREHWKVTGSW